MISLQVVKNIHDLLIEKFGGLKGIRDLPGLEAAIAFVPCSLFLVLIPYERVCNDVPRSFLVPRQDDMLEKEAPPFKDVPLNIQHSTLNIPYSFFFASS